MYRLIYKIFLAVPIFIVISSVVSADVIDFKARLKWSNVIDLSFRVNGTIDEIYVAIGDQVIKGSKLLVLEQGEFLENISIARALKKSRESEFNESNRERERALELYDRTVLSEHELQIAKNNFIFSETNYHSADVALLKAKRDLEYSLITSPIKAIVLSIAVQQYEYINNTFKVTSIITIADVSKIEAHFSVNAEVIKKITNGQSAQVIIADTSYNGQIFFPSMLAKNNAYPIAVRIAMPKIPLRAGQEVIVRIN